MMHFDLNVISVSVQIMDGEVITAMRTAAVSALATKVGLTVQVLI